MVNALRTPTGSCPRAISRSAAQPPSAATAAIPPKLKNVYSPIDSSERCRRSTK